MAVLARSAAAVVALALLVSAVAGEVFFQEKFDGEPPPGSKPPSLVARAF